MGPSESQGTPHLPPGMLPPSPLGNAVPKASSPTPASGYLPGPPTQCLEPYPPSRARTYFPSKRVHSVVPEERPLHAQQHGLGTGLQQLRMEAPSTAGPGPSARTGHTAGSPRLRGRSGPTAAGGPRPEAWQGLCDVTEEAGRPHPQGRAGSGRQGTLCQGSCLPSTYYAPGTVLEARVRV